MFMTIPSCFEKEEGGESISCALCGHIILIRPRRYPESVLEEKIQLHFKNCPAKSADDKKADQLNLF